MGCCLSTKQASSAGYKKNQQHWSNSKGSDSYNNGRDCVPSPSMMEMEMEMEEEESVKEVLSETPAPAHSIAKPKIVEEEDEDEKKTTTPPKPALQNIEEAVVMMKIEKKPPVAEEISETLSEICSASESVSTNTERKDDDDDAGEVKQRVNRSPAKFPRTRSYSGDLTGRRDRAVVGKSPARRSDPSPGRRNDGGVSRSGIGREGTQTTARRPLATNVHRRDCGESSARRSRSPATRTDAGGASSRSVLGRSPSTRKTGQSPGRTRASPLEKNPKMEENKWPPSNESIENPLVSLECFIFL